MDRLQQIKEQYTPENKDKLLAYLLKEAQLNVSYQAIDGNKIAKELGIAIEFIGGFLSEFNELGLIEFKGFLNAHTFDLVVLSNAAALYQRNGFRFQEELFEKNLQVLEGQIKALEPKLPLENYEKLTGILNNVLSLAHTIFGPKM